MTAVRVLHAGLAAAGDTFATGGKYASRRKRFIGIFFKFLTGPSELVVEAAQSALTHVITSNEHGKDKQLLPKELLQACLRPVLSRLQSHRKLTRHLLRGLARLLYLLSNWFNVTLGEKLLEVFISLFVNI